MRPIYRHRIFPYLVKKLKPSAYWYYTFWYLLVRGKFPNISRPKDFSEIMINSIVYNEVESLAQFVDKVKVRDYIKSLQNENLLSIIYGVYSNACEINFENLPKSFVIKLNNGCGGHIFCKDKSKLDLPLTIEYLNKKLNEKYNTLYEPQYKNIKPLILIEEYLADDNGNLPIDYKFQCFNGKPSYIFVGTEREIKVKYTTFDLEWNRLDYIKESFTPKYTIEKPKNLEMMVKIASELSSRFKFVRVDLYDLGNRIVFGELTFTPGSAIAEFFTTDAIKKMGKQIFTN